MGSVIGVFVVDAGLPNPNGGPFCCARCKLLDLGRWIDGQYQVPGQIVETPLLGD